MKKLLIISDVHVPYHDERAVDLMLEVAHYFKPEILVNLGDFIDFYSVSSFARDPDRIQNLEEEITAAKDMLDYLDGIGAKRKEFIEGNHEDRLRRYLWTKAPELFHTVKLERLLDLASRGWKRTEYKDYVKVGKVMYTHDLGYSGRYIAHRALSDAHHSVVVGHAHRFSSVVEGDAMGIPKVAACYGWLGDAGAADYKHRLKANRDWALGFGIGYVDSDGTNYLTGIPVVNYKCVLPNGNGGKLFKG